MTVDLGIAVRGKMKDSEKWHDVHNSMMDAELSTVTVSCPIEIDSKKEFCNSFEVGIIS